MRVTATLRELLPTLEAEGMTVERIDFKRLHELHVHYGLEPWTRCYQAGMELSRRFNFPFVGRDGPTVYYLVGHHGSKEE